MTTTGYTLLTSPLHVIELPLAVGFEGNVTNLFEAQRDFQLRVKFSV
jgi:hypothetical protein